MEKILLIDGFGFIFKAYYAFINRPLTNKNGENTSALFGFFKSIISILKTEKPDYYVVALEGEGPCFRNEIYPEYKANRPPPPEDLKPQIIKIIELLQNLAIPHISIESYEADDIIGTLAHTFKKENGDKEVVIFSIDKDLRQLVGKNVTITYTDRQQNIKSLDETGVLEKMGVKPSQVVDYLALTGDASDNIPGVKGVGPKTAVNLLSEYKTLDNIYKNLDKITSKNVKSKLQTGKDNAFLSRNLAKIKCDIDINIDLADFKRKPLLIDENIEILKDDSLVSVIKAIREYNEETFDNKVGINDSKLKGTLFEENMQEELNVLDKKYEIVKTINDLNTKIDQIKKEGHFCFDLETTGFDFLQDDIICFNISVKDDTFLVPINISKEQQQEADILIDNTFIKNILLNLKQLFEDESLEKIGHNIKFDIKFLQSAGFNVKGKLFDTMLAEYCIDASHNIFNMDDLAEKYLSYKTIHYKDVVEDTKKNTLQDVPLADLLNYACEDADVTYKLYEVLKSKIDSNDEIKKLFYEIEMPLLKILIDMEFHGVVINAGYLNDLSNTLQKEIDLLHQKIIEEADEEFNPNSTKQLKEILFTKLKLPVIKKTKTGPSTDVEVLNELSYIHPIASMLLEYRTLTKIKSTYSDSLPAMVNPKTNKIHTTYMQTGTQTGRLSSKNPNLQNIPVKTEIGKKIRQAFVPSQGNVLISADYSQIELFLLAELSRDENLYSAFKNGDDIHIKTASLIFNKEPEEIIKEERTIGKTINFSILYGQGPFRLSKNLHVSRKEAADFINIYFSKYSGVSRYMEEIRENCRKTGYAKTLWGRKRTIPEINDKNKTVIANGERMAVNTTIQGTAADLIKVSMIKIWNRFKKENIKAKLILQVHDELIFDVPTGELEKVKEIIINCMETDFNFELPLKTSIQTGMNWGELK